MSVLVRDLGFGPDDEAGRDPTVFEAPDHATDYGDDLFDPDPEAVQQDIRWRRMGYYQDASGTWRRRTAR